jgi:uncharacterized protein YecE (DUF72 family)
MFLGERFMQIHVGTSGYGYKEWKGIFYPEKTPDREMLHYYAQRLSAVEINYTFYHMPTEKILASWAEQVPAGFAFSLKASQVITHRKRLKNVGEEADYFFRTLATLGEKMGPALFQFPETFRADRARLADFLALVPAGRLCAFEFRSPTWLEDPAIPDLLREKGCSLCTADMDEKPADAIFSTAPWGYLRLRRSDYTEADLLGWLEKIRAQKWKKAFVFFKHEDKARGAELALRFQDLAGAAARHGKEK